MIVELVIDMNLSVEWVAGGEKRASFVRVKTVE